MGYIFLFTFVFFTVWHLLSCVTRNEDNRKFSKGFILFSIIAFYLSVDDDPSWLVFLAITFSWIGDLLLIPRGNKWFAMGGASFMVSHILFAICYGIRLNFNNISFIYFIVFGVTYLLIVIFVFAKLKEYLPKVLFYPMFFYLLLNATMNTFAICRFVSDTTRGPFITMVGAILFFISDVFLFFVRFNKNSRLKTHFAVMLTYSLGELLIVIGLMI